MWYADDGLTPVTDATRAAVEGAARALADRGLDVFQWRPAGIERAFDLWRIVLNESGVSEIFRLYEGHEDLAGPVIRAMKKHLKPPALEAFVSAWVERDRLRASLVADMTYRPILLAPVASVPAFPHDHRGAFRVGSADVDYLRAFSYAMTFNVLALPACAVPCGRSPEGLPIGVQVVGRPWEEESVLAVAALLEEALGGYQRPPL
jgi:Asp-tRNA(Asn)/Glu-tRNA(Gln) amidotransferase A subunit family amidase